MTPRSPSRRWTWSIRTRVTVVATLVVAVALLGSGVALVLLVHQSLIAGLDAAQVNRAQAVAAQAAAGTLPRSIPETTDQGSLVQLLDPTGAVVASTSNVDGEGPVLAKPPSDRRPTAVTLASSPLDNGSSFRIQAQPVALASGPGWVYVATSLTQVDAATTSLATAFAFGLPLMVAIVGFVVWRSVAVALRPVDRMRQRAAAIGARDLSQRVPVPGSHDEVANLAVTMNGMLDRLESSAVRQREFIGDASHELKSPLAALRAAIDIATAHPEDRDPSLVLADLSDQVTRMTVLTDDLLFLARSTEAQPMTRVEPVDLDELVLAEAHRLRDVGDVSVGIVSVQAARVMGSQRDLGRALRNLAENAREHARSAVRLSLTTERGFATIAVIDDGSGVPPASRERVFERFARLDDSRPHRTGGGGFGLGLAIARQIVVVHGGSLIVRDRTDGSPGAEFILRLPMARP